MHTYGVGIPSDILDFFFALRDYVSETLSPSTVVTGRLYNYNMIYGSGSQIGEYVRIHERTNNTMRSRTVSAIALRPTANSQGSFYYYSLVTGLHLTRRRCIPIIIPDEIIK